MVFRKKSPSKSAGAPNHVLRSRDLAGPAGGGDDNPLARRFHPQDEPDTVDLRDPGRFHAVAESGDPPTSDLRGDGDSRESLISRDPGNGKFYLQPAPDRSLRLNGEAVDSATELRPGDRIDIDGCRFEFLKPENP